MRTIPICLVMACLVAGRVNGAVPEARSTQADCYWNVTAKPPVTEVKHFRLIVGDLKKLETDGNRRPKSYLTDIYQFGRTAGGVASVFLQRTFDYFKEGHDAGFPLGTCTFLCSSSDATHTEREI